MPTQRIAAEMGRAVAPRVHRPAQPAAGGGGGSAGSAGAAGASGGFADGGLASVGGFPPTGANGSPMHIHAHLRIVIDGQEQVIPANVGIGSEGGHPLGTIHTHDATGKLHMESPTAGTFRLQEFFRVWGQTLSSQEILGHRADATHAITMTVNGQPSTAFASLVLHDGDSIVIGFGPSRAIQPTLPGFTAESTPSTDSSTADRQTSPALPSTAGPPPVRESGESSTATFEAVTSAKGSPNPVITTLSPASPANLQHDLALPPTEAGSGVMGSGGNFVVTLAPHHAVYLEDQRDVTLTATVTRDTGEPVPDISLDTDWSLFSRSETITPSTFRANSQFVKPTDSNGKTSMVLQPLGFESYFIGFIAIRYGSTGAVVRVDEKNTTRLLGPPESPPPRLETDGKFPCLGCSLTDVATLSKSSSGSIDCSVGEKKLDIEDLRIPGRGEDMDYVFRRFYQSFDYRKALGIKDFGVAWRYSYADEYLVKDGSGPEDTASYVNFRVGPAYAFANAGPGRWEPEIEHFVQLRKNPFTRDFEIREPNGIVRIYHNFSDTSTPNKNGRLKEIRDRNDNRMTFHYERIDPNGTPGSGDEKFVLAFVIDTLGREIRYQYYAATSQTTNGRPVTVATTNAAAWGRLARVSDFKGNMDFAGPAESEDFPGQVNNRTLVFDYDGEGNLVRASAPEIRATPNGNDFSPNVANGTDVKTSRYKYITTADLPPGLNEEQRGRLLHKLTHIWYPNEVRNNAGTNPPDAAAAEVITYQTNPANPLFGYVATYTAGGTNANDVPSGGTIRYSYTDLNPTRALTSGADLGLEVVDRNGNRAEYIWGFGPVLLEYREFPRGFRSQEPAAYVFTFDYNQDRLLQRRVSPETNVTEYTFNETPDRFQQSNLIRIFQTPDAPRGGDQPKIEQVFVYEPIYNRPCLIVYPRAADMNNNGFTPPIADPAGRTMADPYDPTQTINLRYVGVEFFDFQESRERAALAPDSRTDIDGSGGRVNQSPLIAVDPNVLTTEVWLVQELGLPENAAGLAELRSRLSSNLTRLGLGDLNGDGDTTPTVAGNIVRTVLASPVLLAGSNQHKLETDIETAGDLINEALPYDQGGTAEGAHGGRLQTIVTMYQYNQFGQMTRVISPEGNVTRFEYFPENDPDGDTHVTPAPADGRTLNTVPGGYLNSTVTDTTRSYFDQSGNPSTGAFSNNKTNPAVTNITVSFTYDDVGNTVRTTDGRGIRTDFFVNEHNEVVQTTRAADISGAATANPSDPLFNHPDPNVRLSAFGYRTRTFFDYNSNVVLSQVEDRGNTSAVDGNGLGTIAGQALATTPGLSATNGGDPAGGLAFVDMLNLYDRIDDLIERRLEVSSTQALRTRYRYDGNQNLLVMIYPEGNADSSLYDERDLLFQSTRGASSRPAAGKYAPGDPTTLNRPGGAGTVPSTTTYNYDLNKNLVEMVDAEDTDGDPSNNSDIAGAGDATRIGYDGYDRRTTVTDPLGNTTRYGYDPDSNVVRVIQDGDPIDDVVGEDENKTLAVTEYIHDELSRVVATHQVLFQTPDATPVRTPTLTDTPAMDALAAYLADASSDTAAVPGALPGIVVIGRVTTLSEYDRDSRVTFTVPDDLDVYRTDYDGASRVIKTTDSILANGFSGGVFNPANIAGNTVETAYDDNHNPIERRETDVATIAGIPAEVFRTTYIYDSLDRLQTMFDNLGQAEDYRYDSRNNLVARADAVGPVSTRLFPRRGLGSTANVLINSFGNVTRTFYDGISRTLQTEAILTATGQGDGVHLGATLEGVKDAVGIPAAGIPTPAPSQSEDGRITVWYAWDDNSQLLALRDDDGNTTAYRYDNQGRTLAERKGMNAGFQGMAFTITGGDSGAFREPRRPPDPLSDPPVETEPANIDNGTTIDFGFDRDSNLITLVNEGDVNGVRSTISSTFDALNRRKTVTVNNPPGSQFIGTTSQTFLFDGLSRLMGTFDNNEPASMQDDVTVTFLYDSLSRKVEEQQLIGPIPGIPKMISCSYDIAASGAVWQPSACIYPDGRQVNSSYDALDRLVRRRDNGQDEDIGEYQYIGTWRVATLEYQNGTRLVRDYDDLRRVTRHRWVDVATGNVIVGFAHTYDRANNKLIEEKLHDSGNSEAYTYDSVYRLVTFNRGTLNAARTAIVTPTTTDNALQSQTWTLDGVGNWTANTHKRPGDPLPRTENRTSSDFNEIVTVSGDPYADGVTGTHVLDKNGNLVDDGVRIYQWDALNRLRKVFLKAAGPMVQLGAYTYDSQNRRLRKVVDPTTPDGTTDFYYDGWRVVEEHNGADAITQQYVYGNYLDEVWTLDNRRSGITVAQLNDGIGNQRHFYHNNTLFHVYTLTNEGTSTAPGTIQETYQFDAYGRATVFTGPGPDGIWFTGDEPQAAFSAISNPYTYTGQRLDQETTLMYYKNRYYSTDLGRFINRDPIGYFGGFNLYGYTTASPTNFIDPLGLADTWEAEIEAIYNQSVEFKVGNEVLIPAQETIAQYKYSAEIECRSETEIVVSNEKADRGKLIVSEKGKKLPFLGGLVKSFSADGDITVDRSGGGCAFITITAKLDLETKLLLEYGGLEVAASDVQKAQVKGVFKVCCCCASLSETNVPTFKWSSRPTSWVPGKWNLSANGTIFISWKLQGSVGPCGSIKKTEVKPIKEG